MPTISPYAKIEPGAELAADVRVGAFSRIGPHVRIGPGCVIENNVTILGHTTMGENNHIFPMATIGATPDGSDGDGRCVLGKANAVREHVAVHAGRDLPTHIGDDNLIMIDSRIGDGAFVGNHCILANITLVGAGAKIEDYVRTSGFSTIGDGVIVGAYTFTAGYVNAECDIPPCAIVQGTPLRVRGVNTQNLRRCGFGEDDIRSLKDAFRDLFNGTGSGPDREALRSILSQPGANRHVRRLAEFLQRRSPEARP